MRFKLDYSPETKIFSLQDDEEGCLIVITKKQLEALIKLYNRCCSIKELLKK